MKKTAQEVQEYTAKQAARLIVEAARITGKPAADLTIEDAEAALLKEIGVTDPTLSKQEARRHLIKKIEEEQLKEALQEPTTAAFNAEVVYFQFAKGYSDMLDGMAREKKSTRQILSQNIAAEMSSTKEAQEANKEEPRTYDPRLNINTPEFDIEAYRKSLANAGGMGAMVERIKGSFEAVQKQMQETMLKAVKDTAPANETVERNAEALSDTAVAIAVTAKYFLERISEFVNSDIYKAVKESVAAITSMFAQQRAEIEFLADAAQVLQDLAPFLRMELETMAQDPAFANTTLEDILKQGFDADGNPIESPFRQLIERAKKQQADFKAAEDALAALDQAVKEIPRFIAKPTDKLSYPLDKTNSNIWNFPEGTGTNGQLSIDIVTSKKGSKQDAIVYCGINFDKLEDGVKITKQLDSFDKRVYVAAAALFNAGNSVMSATQIYKMMGNSGQPKVEQVQKINDSLTKMGAARIHLDNTQEVQVNKKYARFKYDASLLPFERKSAYINGQLVESAIHLFREPPLITFARERGQIIGLTRQLLESPISKTAANLQLEDYLLERISHMKNPKSKAPRKMLYSTIYERCGITSRSQRSRAPEKITRYLDHYKSTGWIADYMMGKDGITIHLLEPLKEE